MTGHQTGMRLYIVTEEGMYRHSILGIYTRPGAAEHRAEEAAERSDGYHEYDVGMADEDADIEDIVTLVSYQKLDGTVKRESRTE